MKRRYVVGRVRGRVTQPNTRECGVVSHDPTHTTRVWNQPPLKDSLNTEIVSIFAVFLSTTLDNTVPWVCLRALTVQSFTIRVGLRSLRWQRKQTTTVQRSANSLGSDQLRSTFVPAGIVECTLHDLQSKQVLYYFLR
jgi:hypothetical protein